MKRTIYSIAGVAVLGLAGFFIYKALGSSLVYFILPSEYAASPAEFNERRIRLGGIVGEGTVQFDPESLKLNFEVTDTIQSYPVIHTGAPPELFKEGTGVVIEGHFEGQSFYGDNVLVKHSEQYEPVQAGVPIDVEELKETLQ